MNMRKSSSLVKLNELVPLINKRIQQLMTAEVANCSNTAIINEDELKDEYNKINFQVVKKC